MNTQHMASNVRAELKELKLDIIKYRARRIAIIKCRRRFIELYSSIPKDGV